MTAGRDTRPALIHGVRGDEIVEIKITVSMPRDEKTKELLRELENGAGALTRAAERYQKAVQRASLAGKPLEAVNRKLIQIGVDGANSVIATERGVAAAASMPSRSSGSIPCARAKP
jgi:exonuclease VII small subunit